MEAKNLSQATGVLDKTNIKWLLILNPNFGKFSITSKVQIFWSWSPEFVAHRTLKSNENDQIHMFRILDTFPNSWGLAGVFIFGSRERHLNIDIYWKLPVELKIVCQVAVLRSATSPNRICWLIWEEIKSNSRFWAWFLHCLDDFARKWEDNTNWEDDWQFAWILQTKNHICCKIYKCTSIKLFRSQFALLLQNRYPGDFLLHVSWLDKTIGHGETKRMDRVSRFVAKFRRLQLVACAHIEGLWEWQGIPASWNRVPVSRAARMGKLAPYSTRDMRNLLDGVAFWRLEASRQYVSQIQLCCVCIHAWLLWLYGCAQYLLQVDVYVCVCSRVWRYLDWLQRGSSCAFRKKASRLPKLRTLSNVSKSFKHFEHSMAGTQ